MRLLLATILQRFIPELVAGFPVVPMPRVTLRLKHGLLMTLASPPASPAPAPSLEAVG
jgi:hypothetical protein